MSSLKVEIVQPDAILVHPKADRLEIAQVKGWQCVVPKGEITVDTWCVYFPIDSILPETIEAKLFGPESKIKLSNHRVKTVKIRGIVSQGLLVNYRDLFNANDVFLGDDVTKILGVTKYEPPVEITSQSKGRQTSKKQSNPNFHKYTDIENYKNFPFLFQANDAVWVLEKIHGTNFRAGWVKCEANTWWKKMKKFFGLFPDYEFVYGSHNVQLQWAKTNIYLEAVEKYDLRNKLKPGEVIYGEIYGEGVQKGCMYDCKPGERKMAVFDVMIEGEYINHIEVKWFCLAYRGLNLVPSLFIAQFALDTIKPYVDKPSELGGGLREGIVIKPMIEAQTSIGRQILKWKSDKFLLQATDDTH